MTLANKHNAFNEFFSIEHRFNINISPLKPEDVNHESFINNIPLPFKIASEVSRIEQSAINPLPNLKNEASQLVTFLNNQSQKIDLLVSYILNQEDNIDNRFNGTQLGGAGIIFESNNAYNDSTHLALKLFLTQENCAVFCYGEIISEELIDNIYRYKVLFSQIQDEDRETLVRTSLHLQSKQLKKLAQERSQDSQ